MPHGLLSEKLLPSVVFAGAVGILNIYWLRIHVAPTSASQFTWQLRPTRSDRLLLAEPAGVHQEAGAAHTYGLRARTGGWNRLGESGEEQGGRGGDGSDCRQQMSN